MNTWFTSDLHLGHERVAQLRGFSDVETHDAAILDNWISAVDPIDIVWMLGDLCLGNPEPAINALLGLPGRKHLISGNHDKCHGLHKDAHKWQPRYLAAFDSVQTFARRNINGEDVLLSHFPYRMDHTPEPRYGQWRLRDEGAWILHGHTHGRTRRVGREIHVGTDAWDFTPVSLSTIAMLMNEADNA